MEILKLNETHKDALLPLFTAEKFMGSSIGEFVNIDDKQKISKLYYNLFSQTYLSGLENFNAFGAIENGVVTATISFYESVDNAEWFGTQIRSTNKDALPLVLDAVAAYNESKGRLKFYSLFNAKYARSFRRLVFSPTMRERYGYFDEYLVPAKHKCFYNTPWQSLFNRTLVPMDTIVRCTFLKQEYRTTLPVGGGL